MFWQFFIWIRYFTGPATPLPSQGLTGIRVASARPHPCIEPCRQACIYSPHDLTGPKISPTFTCVSVGDEGHPCMDWYRRSSEESLQIIIIISTGACADAGCRIETWLIRASFPWKNSYHMKWRLRTQTVFTAKVHFAFSLICDSIVYWFIMESPALFNVLRLREVFNFHFSAVCLQKIKDN